MKCVVCGVESQGQYCDKCGKIMDDIINEVGEELWSTVNDCSHIYPMVRRAAKGDLTVRDIRKSLMENAGKF